MKSIAVSLAFAFLLLSWSPSSLAQCEDVIDSCESQDMWYIQNNPYIATQIEYYYWLEAQYIYQMSYVQSYVTDLTAWFQSTYGYGVPGEMYYWCVQAYGPYDPVCQGILDYVINIALAVCAYDFWYYRYVVVRDIIILW